MDILKIGFCIRDQNYAEIIERYFVSLDNNKFDIVFISENKIKTKYKNIDLNNYIDENSNKDIPVLDRKIWKNQEIYKADPRFINKDKSINRRMYFEYIFACRKIFANENFDVIFSGSAGRLIWTVPHLVALEKNVLAYKLVPADYLNPYFEGYRIWFCTDIFWDIDINSHYDFDWPSKKTEEQISLLKKSMLQDNFNLAARAIKSRERYTPSKFSNILKNIIRVILKNDFLSKQRLKSLYHSKKNKRYYIDIRNLPKKYFIYPLNQPFDEQLLVRAPSYTDTIKNIKLIARNLPKEVDLVVKEHPVNPGMISTKHIKTLEHEFKNIKFIDPKLPIRPLILKSVGLITINSTAGIESLICNKKIIVLGDSYYKYNDMVFKPKTELEIKNAMQEILNQDNFDFSSTSYMIKQLLNQTYPESSTYPSKKGDGNQFIKDALLYKINQLYNIKNP